MTEKKTEKQKREERLAENLRANLRRRKAAARKSNIQTNPSASKPETGDKP